MDDASPRGPARYANGRFGPGNPGRRSGARNRMTQRIALGLLRHFEQNEADLMTKLSSWQHLPVYMRLIDRMLAQSPEHAPGEFELLAPEDAARVTGAVRAALDRVEAGQGSLAEIAAALEDAGGEVEAPQIR